MQESLAGFSEAAPASWARLRIARSASTHLLKAEADMPRRRVLARGATKPVPLASAEAPQR